MEVEVVDKVVALMAVVAEAGKTESFEASENLDILGLVVVVEEVARRVEQYLRVVVAAITLQCSLVAVAERFGEEQAADLELVVVLASVLN